MRQSGENRLSWTPGEADTGKASLFFLLIGIITAILLAGICIAAF